MSKESSVIIQRNKEKLQERLIKSIKFFLKKKKNKKNDNMVSNDIKISQRMKSKS